MDYGVFLFYSLTYKSKYYIIDDHLGRIPTMDEIIEAFVGYCKS